MPATTTTTITHRCAARFPLVEELTDRVLGWYGFTEMSDYRMVPVAMEVAIELHRLGATPDTLTSEQIETADANTGGKVRSIWQACQPPAPKARGAGGPLTGAVMSSQLGEDWRATTHLGGGQ